MQKCSWNVSSVSCSFVFCNVLVICCVTVRLSSQLLFVVVTIYVHVYNYLGIAKFRIILLVLLLLLI